uniref:Uncharacterized protein n=1 Tax=Haptolina brevifila TaxID=156173 RepID=A0A7S2JL27_9EUKA|mmetsp:Transcript_84434/g.168613  ORF Transcript_84434/g.168613 Transcript_84434/m.168613 type:complete len:135 (+) Transcript_84434:19-423(+)
MPCSTISCLIAYHDIILDTSPLIIAHYGIILLDTTLHRVDVLIDLTMILTRTHHDPDQELLLREYAFECECDRCTLEDVVGSDDPEDIEVAVGLLDKATGKDATSTVGLGMSAALSLLFWVTCGVLGHRGVERL